MNADAFEACIWEAFRALPAIYREACAGLSVRSVDLPLGETLAAMNITDPYDVLGLYHGVSLADKSVLDTPSAPDMVFLYRLPILAYAASEGLPVEDVVRHVLVHEIGHHFGFSDDDMEAIEEG